jgi:TFIIF-interacting CTD phosphatase-like protein
VARREQTLPIEGMHVKDLSRLNRDPRRTILVDNSPESYLLQASCPSTPPITARVT